MHYAVQFVYLSPKTKYQKREDYLEKRLEWVHSIHSSRHQFKITVTDWLILNDNQFTSTSSHFESWFTTNINDIKI